MPSKTVLYLLFLLSLLYSSSHACAQDTTAAVKKQSAQKATKDTLIMSGGRLVSTLSTATGYYKMPDGKWVHSPNRIPFDNPLYNNPLYSQYKLGTENFSQINIHEMKVNGKAYYVLIVQRLRGYFKDKEELDFKYYTTADYYFFDKKDLSKLYSDTMKAGKFYCACLPIIYSGEIRHYSAAKMFSQINFDANNNFVHRHLYDTTVKLYFQLLMHPVKGKAGMVMRFNTALAYAKTGSLPAENNFSSFEEQYYQLAITEYKKFARPQAKTGHK